MLYYVFETAIAVNCMVPVPYHVGPIQVEITSVERMDMFVSSLDAIGYMAFIDSLRSPISP